MGINPDEGYFVPISTAQSKTLVERCRQRNIVGGTMEKASPAITPAVIEQQEGDPQLAAARKTMTARLESGSFTNVSKLTAAKVDPFLKHQEIEQRRETARHTLETLDRELAESN